MKTFAQNKSQYQILMFDSLLFTILIVRGRGLRFYGWQRKSNHEVVYEGTTDFLYSVHIMRRKDLIQY